MKHAQLWKRILNEGVWVPPELPWLEHRIIAAPIISSSIAYESGTNYYYDWAKFTAVAVPFDRSFWIEAPVRGVLADGSAVPDGERIGWFVTPLRYKGGDCMLRIIGIGQVGSRKGAQAAVCIALDKNGNLLPGGDAMNMYDKQLFASISAGQGFTEIDLYQSLCDYVLCVLQFLSCKNASLELRDNDPKEVQRALKRHGGNADNYRYHVLTVRPAGSKAGTPGEEMGIMPRHVCRGHFAEYGPEFNKGLLFGKYSGRFFIPPHMKGKRENGVVEKDYRLAPNL